MTSRSILIVTVVHHPLDARIFHRQIGALREAGWRVTYAAPFSGYGLRAEDVGSGGLTTVDLPRAQGRSRVRALRAARRLLRTRGRDHDLVLLHDAELVLVAGARGLPPVVWDVHEDTAAAVHVRPWVPSALRLPLSNAVRWIERRAEDRFDLLLADHDYVTRFRRPHPVVPNTTEVPPEPGPGPTGQEGRHRVVYLGSITLERGAAEMVEVARRLPPHVRLELIGPAHGPAGQLIREAAREGVVDWRGFVPSDQATAQLSGALAGLCLLHDEANFRPSMATKVVEYLAHGVPAVVTPLPRQRDLVERSEGGVVVPFGDVDSVVDTLCSWAADPRHAQRLGRAGHAYVHAHHNWAAGKVDFVGALESVAVRGA